MFLAVWPGIDMNERTYLWLLFFDHSRLVFLLLLFSLNWMIVRLRTFYLPLATSLVFPLGTGLALFFV